MGKMEKRNKKKCLASNFLKFMSGSTVVQLFDLFETYPGLERWVSTRLERHGIHHDTQCKEKRSTGDAEDHHQWFVDHCSLKYGWSLPYTISAIRACMLQAAGRILLAAESAGVMEEETVLDDEALLETFDSMLEEIPSNMIVLRGGKTEIKEVEVETKKKKRYRKGWQTRSWSSSSGGGIGGSGEGKRVKKRAKKAGAEGGATSVRSTPAPPFAPAVQLPSWMTKGDDGKHNSFAVFDDEEDEEEEDEDDYDDDDEDDQEEDQVDFNPYARPSGRGVAL
jgi:hypothetical protein